MNDQTVLALSRQVYELTQTVEQFRAQVVELRRQVERPELPMVATVCHLTEVVERRLEPLALSGVQRADVDYWSRYTGVQRPL